MRATVSYTVLRLLLFVVAFFAIRAAGASGLLALALAAVVSGLISFVVLSRQRDSISASISGRLSNFRHRLDEGTRAEDQD
ncbi:MAG: DUF4229 domain-containing protein [Streptosporangiaceae bacterium]|jgi:uncharacterized membrane-anchored protein|nr:hypothetical protein [Actinomycetota bacterium]